MDTGAQKEKLLGLSLALINLNIISREQQLSTLELFLRLDFIRKLPIFINYVRGLDGGMRLLPSQIETIIDVSSDFKSGKITGAEAIGQLIDSKILTARELYLCFVLFSQKHFFDLRDDGFLDLARSCVSREFPIQNPDGLRKLAVFGATYATMKERFAYGFGEFQRATGRNPERTYLLTGIRTIYAIELVQLGIVKNPNDPQYKALVDGMRAEKSHPGVPRVSDFCEYFDRHPEINVRDYIDFDRLKKVVSRLIKIQCPDNEDVLGILKFLSTIGEQELARLGVEDAVGEGKMPANFDMNTVSVVYSSQTSARDGTRSNTEDTIRDLCAMDGDFGSMLFVSDGINTRPQTCSIYDALLDCGVGAPVGRPGYEVVGSQIPEKANVLGYASTSARILFAGSRFAARCMVPECDLEVETKMRQACGRSHASKIPEDYEEAYAIGRAVAGEFRISKDARAAL